MLPTSLRLALRRLARRPGTTAVHVGGLAVGLACCFLAILYVADEQSFDRFHEDADRIVTVEQQIQFGDQTVRISVAGEKTVEALRTNAPGVVGVASTKLEAGLVRRPGEREGIPVEARAIASVKSLSHNVSRFRRPCRLIPLVG